MVRAPEGRAEQRVALGRRLVECRAAAGWTQQRLAGATFVDRSYVGHAESGRSLPGRRFWVVADTALEAGGDLVAAFDALDRELAAGVDDGGATDPQSVAERSLAFADRVVCSNVGGETLEHLRWEVGRLAVAYVHADLDVVFGELVGARDALFGLIEGRQRPQHTRELFFLAGATCLLLAHGSQNLGDERAALVQLRCAWTCIDQADHVELRTWARGSAALVAEWSSSPAKAVRLAGEALDLAPVGAARVRLAAIQARAAARVGDRRTAVAASALAADGEGAGPGELAELGGLFTFPEAKRQFYLGGTFVMLGDHGAARAHSTAAVELYGTGPVEERSYGDEALARLDLAQACLHDDDPDRAVRAAAPVFELPTGRRIRQLDTAMSATAAAVTVLPKASRERARELEARIAAYRRGGHARALSSAG